MSRTFRPLLLAAACLLLVAPSPTEARQPRRGYYAPPYARPRPVYQGVYVFPQIVTSPVYPAFPDPGYPYAPRVYGSYSYTPGSYLYSYSPVWGSGYRYTNPSYYFWYRIN